MSENPWHPINADGICGCCGWGFAAGELLENEETEERWCQRCVEDLTDHAELRWEDEYPEYSEEAA